MKTRPGLLAACLTLAAGRASAESPALLPDVSVHLKAARYEPTEANLHWTGWIGAGAGLVRVAGTTVYFTADVETILGDTRRAFDATQANYHLEPGVRRRLGPVEAAFFFHHVSRHYVDRPKEQAVDWNILGARVSFQPPTHVPTRVTLGLGHTTEAAFVGYRWEATAEVTSDLVTRQWGQVYLAGWARAVTAKPSDELPREGFVDVVVEGGVHWSRESRSLELFAAYEHRNDVFLEALGTRDRALLGFRIGYATSRPSRWR